MVLSVCFGVGSYKKPHNAQGAQSRVNSGGIHTAAADSSVNASGPRNVQNGGGHLQQTQLHGIVLSD